MKYYTSDGTPRVHVLQFDPDDLLLEGIGEFIAASGIRDGVVISGIGTLKNTTMHMVTTTTFPPVETFPTFDDQPLELTSMQGVIADGVPHIHMNVSDRRTGVGGHLEPKCEVLYLAEVAILELPGLSLTRVPGVGDALKLVPRPAGQQGAGPVPAAG